MINVSTDELHCCYTTLGFCTDVSDHLLWSMVMVIEDVYEDFTTLAMTGDIVLQLRHDTY